MWPDRVLNPGPLTYESGALPTALRGLALVGNSFCILYSYSAAMLLKFNSKIVRCVPLTT